MEQTVISVIGPSGGVGKSTIAKELAIAYARTIVNGKPLAVCVIDANLGLGAQQALFRLAPKYFIEDWLDDLYREINIRGHQNSVNLYDWDRLEKYLSHSIEHGVYILPTSLGWYFQNNREPGDVSLPIFNVLLLSLKKYFDVIIIDTGNNMTEVTLSAMALADKNLLLLTDEKRSLTAVGKLKQMIRSRNIPFYKFIPVLNQYPEKKSNQIYTIDEINQVLLEITIAHTITWDKRVWTFNNMNDSILLHPEPSKIKQQLSTLAKSLIPEFSPLS